MYASRVIAGFIAGTLGAVAGVAAGAAVGFVTSRGSWGASVLLDLRMHTYLPAPLTVGILVFLLVMMVVFEALERTGLVADPPAQKNAL